MGSSYEYRQARYWRRKAWLNMMKLERGCDRCGYRRAPAALDWDHLPGQVKAFQISQAWSRSEESILAEVAKCQLLCSNCHREDSQERRTPANWRGRSVREVKAPTEEAA